MYTNLVNRILTSILIVLITTVCVYYNNFTFLILYFFISIFSLIELYNIFNKTIYKINYYIYIINGIIIYFLYSLILIFQYSEKYFIIIIPLILLSMIFSIFHSTKYAINNIFIGTGILMYILIGFLSFISIKFIQKTDNNFIIIGILTIIWIYDSSSYLFGSLIGKTIIIKSISPNKTWEGLLCGSITSIYLSIQINYIIQSILDCYDWIIISIIIILFGTLGDFIESNIKRNLNIKDTSHIFPGHGGFLDRFDSLILSSPFILSYITIKYL
ncbi:MAG: phosphatidate cytidylyltransferase [Bacteroides sp.]|nr:MAG: phosphatidate cytidylyltransferase [Bacteroides sp.]